MPTQIRGDQIQPETVSSDNILNNSITTDDIATGTILPSDLSSTVIGEIYKVKVNSGDASADYLSNKITGGQGATISTGATVKVSAPIIPIGLLGDGSDGAATLDGTAVTWATLSGSIYTMTRDCYCTNLTINAGYTLRVANYLPLVNGKLTNNGIIESRGNDASGATQGSAYSTAGPWFSSGGAGGAGSAGGANGGNGTGSGGNSTGGGGGNGGGAGVFTGGLGNTSALLTSSFTGYRTVSFLAIRRVTSNNNWNAVNGSGGGGGGAATANGTGGGGGGAAGLCAVACDVLENNGTIQSVGGTGANGTFTAAGIAGGGGGGSAGPVFIFANTVLVTGTIQSVGGGFGNGANGGANGAAGAANIVVTIKGS